MPILTLEFGEAERAAAKPEAEFHACGPPEMHLLCRYYNGADNFVLGNGETMTGHPPMPAIERLMDDRLQPLSDIARGQYSEPFLAAIDAALSLHPRNRPQSAAEFWTMLSCCDRSRPVSWRSAPSAFRMSALPET